MTKSETSRSTGVGIEFTAVVGGAVIRPVILKLPEEELPPPPPQPERLMAQARIIKTARMQRNILFLLGNIILSPFEFTHDENRYFHDV
jgi:hypothetical protein